MFALLIGKLFIVWLWFLVIPSNFIASIAKNLNGKNLMSDATVKSRMCHSSRYLRTLVEALGK